MKNSFSTIRALSFVAILVLLFIGWKALSSPAAPGAGAPGAPPAGASGGGTGGAPAAPGLPVVLTRVRHKAVQQLLFVTGSLKTDQDVRVGSRIPGKVVLVSVKEGDKVH